MSQAKPRRNKVEIDALLQKWHESGSSVRQFCAEHGIAASGFYQWLSQRGLATPTSAQAKSKRASPRKKSVPRNDLFSEVQVTGQRNHSSGFTLRTPSGHILTFDSCPFDADSLVKIVGGLR